MIEQTKAPQRLACTALELLENPRELAAAKADWAARMKNRRYTTLIPSGQKAPAAIR